MTAMGYSIQAGLGLLQHPADSAQNVAICHMMQDTLRPPAEPFAVFAAGVTDKLN